MEINQYLARFPLFQARMKSHITSQQLESIPQIAKHTLASINPETQPVSEGLLMENSKIFPKCGSENII